MKKLLVLCSLCFISVVHADELSNILSDNKKLLFDYEFQSNEAQSDMLEKSWINPIMLQYSRNYSEQFGDKRVQTGSFSVGIDQPIFRSGGIYYAIKYAQVLREGNEASILLQKRETIVNAIKLLFEMKKLKLQMKKLQLLIKNDEIDIHQKKESYNAGLIDSSFLDQAILKKNQDETTLLQSEISMANLEQNFALLSDKNPQRLKLPKLKLISAQNYKGKNLELVRDRLRAKEKGYNAKMTWAKYLPSISLKGRYIDEDINPLFARPDSSLKERYFTYGFSISMPLNINMFSDIEASKVAHLKAQTEVIEREHSIESSYKMIQKKLKIIDKQIKLSKKDEKLYKRLYRNTKNLAQAGEKTSYDTAMMRHSMKIKVLEQKIYALDKQMALLELYKKVSNAI